MSKPYQSFIEAKFRGSKISGVEKIQSLWSGYGEILRIHLEGVEYRSVILKRIRLPQPSEHPRGWGGELSHQRKLKSYRVETAWYRDYASQCTGLCRVPKCLGVQEGANAINLVLSDLYVEGFSEVRNRITPQQVRACLSWLANFHAVFMQKPGDGLWECGTYWHLDTRPDELASLNDERLKRAAPLIDQALKQCRNQTLVHGDAKVANFCFTPNSESDSASSVAAVDFQYVGRGCGMKDVAYFLGSCMSDRECENLNESLLSYYFRELDIALRCYQPQVDRIKLEQEWRLLFDVAWADFYRFLKGWSPGHWKLNRYSEKISQSVVERLLSKA